WAWDFDCSVDSDGDGLNCNDADSNEQNPTHEYTAPGSYTVSLRVNNDYCQSNDCKMMQWEELDYIKILSPDGSPATLNFYNNFKTIGIIACLLPGVDENNTATAKVEYRTGSGNYQDGLALTRIDDRFVGSLFNLNPDTSYDIRITFSDPNDTTSEIDQILLDGAAIEDAVTTRSELEVDLPIVNNSYYVSPDGSETAACSFEEPCDLYTALKRALPGDEVVLRGGVYYDKKVSFYKYNEDKGITIRGYEGEDAILDGSYPDSNSLSWQDEENGVYSTSLNGRPEYLSLELKDGEIRDGLSINESPTGELPFIILVNGKRLFPYSTSSDLSDDLQTLQDLSTDNNSSGFFAKVVDEETGEKKLYVHLKDDSIPSDNDMVIARQDRAFSLRYTKNFHFENLSFRNYGTGYYKSAVYINDSSNNVVNDCIFAHNTSGVMVKGNSGQNVIQNSLIYSNFNDWTLDDVGNKATGLGLGGVHFIKTTGRGNVIRNNTVHGLINGMAVGGYKASIS
ncbi:MAG: PKD domain-containing protein, partial [Alphaproteobacteria bacterium]|nr:PKD domain-containing protein [Alphaproteobacteria bacterium]